METTVEEEENKQIWEPNESDVIETFNVFKKEIDSLVDSINTYWYAGTAKNQSVNILCAVLMRTIKTEGTKQDKSFWEKLWDGAEVDIGLYELCEWWIETYPEDIFVTEPKEVVQIRNLMKEILKKRKRG